MGLNPGNVKHLSLNNFSVKVKNVPNSLIEIYGTQVLVE